MQLILPQSELEQAIKNYVNDLMNVKDGTELSIDLRAGRGLDGFTATVDIIKAGTAMPAKTVVPAAVIPAPVPVAAPVKVTPRPVAKEEPVAEEKPAEDTSVANKSEQQEAASEAKEETPAEAPTTVRRPLFGSLKKPE
jgi:hypothetical protein